MGYLKRIADKKYRIIYDVPSTIGKRRQKTETLAGMTKAEAEAYLAKKKSQVGSGLHIYEEASLAMLFTRFMDSRRLANRSPKTLERYEHIYRSYIGPAFKDVPVRSLRQGHLSETYARWANKGVSGRALSARSLRHIHDLIRAMLNYAVRKDLALRNVAALVSDELPKAPTPNPTAHDEANLRQLLHCADAPSGWARSHKTVSAQPWFAPAVHFSASTGTRRGETLALRWSDVDFKERIARISRSLCQIKSGLLFKEPKNGKPRTVVLPLSLVETLRAHRERQDKERDLFGSAYRENDLVFAMPDGRPVVPWTFTTSFRHLVKRAGVPYIRLHDLRGTHASLLAKHGVPLEVVSKRLGHSSIAVTAERYLHVYRDRDADAAAVFDRLIS